MCAMQFPDNFIWGSATASYQIEGAWNEDERGVSIWDTFCRLPGKVENFDNGDVAADHYHRWQQDIGLMKEIGLQAYRFSVAWPRVFPKGSGAVNPAGLDFYDRLVDVLLENDIRPFVTLYHWDLPQALQDAGGWPERQTAQYFAEYAWTVAKRLGDRVEGWITHNEPWVVAALGHLTGVHAPGVKDQMAAYRTGIHLLYSHGLAVEALRAELKADSKIGITLNLSPIHPASDREEDIEAAKRGDLLMNRVFLEPLLLGKYPDEMAELSGEPFPEVSQDDLNIIAAPIDFLGINYYTRSVVTNDPYAPVVQTREVPPEDSEYSQMWEIYPAGLYEILTGVWEKYIKEKNPDLRMYITENGICVPDEVGPDGKVHDEKRTRYLNAHFEQAWRAIEAGVPLDGYFVWSLMDNFEWAFGYQMRFGLIHVDYETQQRTIKNSAHWYKRVIQQNGLG